MYCLPKFTIALSSVVRVNGGRLQFRHVNMPLAFSNLLMVVGKIATLPFCYGVAAITTLRLSAYWILSKGSLLIIIGQPHLLGKGLLVVVLLYTFIFIMLSCENLGFCKLCCHGCQAIFDTCLLSVSIIDKTPESFGYGLSGYPYSNFTNNLFQTC